MSRVFDAMTDSVIGIGLISICAHLVLQIVPADTLVPPGRPVGKRPQQLIRPKLTLVLSATSYILRLIHVTMIEVLDSGFVEMARLKGVPEKRVILRHAVPHALGPVAQVVAIQLAWLAGGVVVVEFLFRYPGLGQALIDAVTYRDVQVVQAISMLVAAVYVVVNLAADVVGILTNPKLRSAA